MEERMRAAGPGTPGTPLPTGLQRLKAFEAEAADFAAQREQLRCAEMLFGMEPTSYPALAKARMQDVCNTSLIYAS